ncbi:MAG: DUF4367 domain-containing protein [Lachnospiraceae bacterium]|jgi:hypothetical protein|nr:DUF4367 domain-containing protein [Lachnospiraceae bacterium]
MKKKDLKETLKQEIESEAATLERRVSTKKHLATLEMPKDSYKELMERIKAREKEMKEEKANARLHQRAKILPFPAPARRKTWATVAMVAVLVAGTGVGVKGAKLYMLNVEKQEEGAFDIITDTEDIRYIELNEEEAYDKIEEKIGILALRLTDRPKEMVLKELFIDTKIGEALMEFQYDNHILTIYENKQNRDVSFNAQQDGVVVDTIEIFHLGKAIDITEIDKGNDEMFFAAQLEYENAFYYLSSDIELEKLKSILYGIIFENS